MTKINKFKPLDYLKNWDLRNCCKTAMAALCIALSVNGCGFADESKQDSLNNNQANTTLVSQNTVSQNIPSDFSPAVSFQDCCYGTGN